MRRMLLFCLNVGGRRNERRLDKNELDAQPLKLRPLATEVAGFVC